MGAGKFMGAAERTAMPSKGMSRYDTCSCHPRAWGLKKGLRRARRRVNKLVIIRELSEDKKP